MKLFVRLFLATALVSMAHAAIPPLLDKHCVECHDAETKKGDFDLTALKSDLTQPQVFAQWVKVYDPRLDSTFPGGSGPQRADNEATWAWSERPATCCRARWPRGGSRSTPARRSPRRTRAAPWPPHAAHRP
mgnify:CR=1 FL=1